MKFEEKKHVKPKCDCKKKKKEEKLKNLGIIEIENQEKQNSFFPYNQKNHNSINDSEKKINPFLPNEKIADSST